mmetsp:Transcript_73775/g.227833  ORF Transcript_73775/g.227833 Transcript_73775/m.227833 type:complete len:96 (-) Transcript_73775:1910-2197(-)
MFAARGPSCSEAFSWLCRASTLTCRASMLALSSCISNAEGPCQVGLLAPPSRKALEATIDADLAREVAFGEARRQGRQARRLLARRKCWIREAAK